MINICNLVMLVHLADIIFIALFAEQQFKVKSLNFTHVKNSTLW